MQLLLTSSGLKGIEKNLIELLGKDSSGCKVAFIPAAADPYKDKWFVELARNELAGLGMKIINVDLKTETKNTLGKKLAKCDIIFVSGGNTFYLLDCVRKCGFDRIIKNILKNKIYVGSSAGSILACPTIETAGWKHADRNVVKIKDLTALKLVNFLITPHYTKEVEEAVKEATKKAKYPVVALRDGQAILVKGRSVKIVGKGGKYLFSSLVKT